MKKPSNQTLSLNKKVRTLHNNIYLQNEYFVGQIGFDTANNRPSKIWVTIYTPSVSNEQAWSHCQGLAISSTSCTPSSYPLFFQNCFENSSWSDFKTKPTTLLSPWLSLDFFQTRQLLIRIALEALLGSRDLGLGLESRDLSLET